MRYTIIFLLAALMMGCRDVKIGYLKTENAEYQPNLMMIPKFIDESDPANALRIANNAPWVTSMIQGVLGTQPIQYSIASVKASNGGDADKFKSELIIRGAGYMEIPLRPESPKGTYIVSVRIHNQGYSNIVADAYTFIIE